MVEIHCKKDWVDLKEKKKSLIHLTEKSLDKTWCLLHFRYVRPKRGHI